MYRKIAINAIPTNSSSCLVTTIFLRVLFADIVILAKYTAVLAVVRVREPVFDALYKFFHS